MNISPIQLKKIHYDEYTGHHPPGNEKDLTEMNGLFNNASENNFKVTLGDYVNSPHDLTDWGPVAPNDEGSDNNSQIEMKLLPLKRKLKKRTTQRNGPSFSKPSLLNGNHDESKGKIDLRKVVSSNRY